MTDQLWFPTFSADEFVCERCNGTGMTVISSTTESESEDDDTIRVASFTETCDCGGTGEEPCTYCGESAVAKDLVTETYYCAECLAAAKTRRTFRPERLVHRRTPAYTGRRSRWPGREVSPAPEHPCSHRSRRRHPRS